MEVIKKQNIYLVAGANTILGVAIVKALLTKKRNVHVLIKSEDQLKEFTEEEISQIKSVTICDILNQAEYTHKLDIAFDKNVTHIISAFNLNPNSKSHKDYYNIQTRLIDIAKKHNIQKFLLISSAHVTKPYSCHSLSLNLFHQYTQWNRVRVEEYLRNSGVKYLIVRSGEIVNGSDATEYTINQGDKLVGSINNNTLGKLAVDTFVDPWIPENVTYECITNGNQSKDKYSYVQGRFRLNSDTEKEKSKALASSHLVACRLVKFGFFFILSTGALSVAYHLNDQFRKWVKQNVKLLK